MTIADDGVRHNPRTALTEAIEQVEDAMSIAEGTLSDARDRLYALRALIAPNGDMPDPAVERRALAAWNEMAGRKEGHG